MSFQISNAVTDGIDRVLTRTGGILFVILSALTLLNTALSNTVTASILPPEAAPQVRFTLPIPGAVAGLLTAVVTLFSFVLLVVMARAFARPNAELSTFPSELYTRRMGRVILSTLVASIIVFVSVAIGMVLLIVPGVFLALSFLFYQFAIGVEDRGAIGSLRRSWELSSGNRLKLLFVLALVVVIGVVNAIVSGVFGLLGLPGVGTVVAAVLSTAVGLFYNGILAASYLQLANSGTRQL